MDKMDQSLKVARGTAARGRILFISLMLIFLGVVAACGGNPSSGAPTAGARTAPVPETTKPPAPEVTPGTPPQGGGPPCAKTEDVVNTLDKPTLSPDGTAVFTLPKDEVNVMDEVIVTVPKQNQGGAVVVQILRLGTLDDLLKEHDKLNQPRATKEFSPTRLVANFQVVWVDGPQAGKCLRHFDPPPRFQVPYTESDVKIAGGLDKLRLAWADHERGRWMPFTEKDGFQVKGDEKGGFLIVDKFAQYGDPHMAHGVTGTP